MIHLRKRPMWQEGVLGTEAEFLVIIKDTELE